MQEAYKALVKEGVGEIVEKKSRFIGYAFSVETEEEAFKRIEEIRKKHYDARHNCYAFSIGTGLPTLRFSDDGEPQGTAGKPILEVINGSEIKNILIVVTRYFGGTLLGTGGLIRAYTDASKEALANSEIRVRRKLSQLMVETNYSDSGRVQYILANTDCEIVETEYGGSVLFTVNVPTELEERLTKDIVNQTSARATVEKLDEIFG